MSKTALEDASRWYSVDKTGAATLCIDEADAIHEAEKNNKQYPRNAPHRAAQLVPYADLSALLADLEAAKAAPKRLIEAAATLKDVCNRPSAARTRAEAWRELDAALAQMAKGE